MNKKQWNEALNHLDQDLVEEYIAKKDEKRKPARPFWVATAAAVLALTVGIGALAGKGILPQNPPVLETVPATSVPATTPSTEAPIRPVVTVPPATLPPSGPVVVPLGNLLAQPVYPEMVKYPDINDYGGSKDYAEAYTRWRNNQLLQYAQPDGYADSLTDFFQKSMAQFLEGEGNQVYSPVNVYLAMAMLAETAGGNSRQQILDLFGLDTIEQLREQAYYLWNAHYCDDGKAKLLLANSLWLDEEYSFHQETAQLLAQRYFASSYRGDLGTAAMDKQLQNWINANTSDLLKEQAEKIELSPETVFALVSTIDFAADWTNKFNAEFTKDGIFHSAQKDITVPFMNKGFSGYGYYWGENFSAICLWLEGNNQMWLILPDAGYTTADVLKSDEYLKMTQDPETWENKGIYDVNLSLPKFDVSCQQDLVNGMKTLGISDVFDHTRSDFTPITETTQLYVDKIDHAARVRIDEDGCEGAAFTEIGLPMGAAPVERETVDFVLDRPFVFVVSSRDCLPLFAGVVNQP